MGRLVQAAAYFFAVVGLVVTGGAGYVYVTNAELAGEFWAVKDEFKALPSDRRQAVMAELPVRVTFEREIADDMDVLSDERQAELYEQLEKDRARVLEQFSKRVAAEAEIARTVGKVKQTVNEATDILRQGVSDVASGLEPGGSRNALDDVMEAEKEVDAAVARYGSSRQGADSAARVNAAVEVLAALDRLGDEISDAKQAGLNDPKRAELSKVVTRAKSTLFMVKGTPGLEKHPEAQKLLRRVPSKLSSE